MKTKLTLEMETKIVEKLRKYFPGKIGEILESKALQAIAEMENPEETKTFSTNFTITETREGWVNYAPQRFMEKKEYVFFLSLLNPGVTATSELICDMVDNKLKGQRVSQVGKLPEKNYY